MSNYVSESHIIPDDFPQSNVDIRVELITEWILRGLETFRRTVNFHHCSASGQWMSRIFIQFPPLSFLARPRGAASLIPKPPAMDFVGVAETTDTLRVRSHVQYNTPDHITPTNLHRSPLEQFHIWFNEARIAGVTEPEAMSLSTATASGIPSSRMVLFKQLDKHGFVFYTNYTSRKSKELQENPHAALLFFWREMSRQVRIVGRVEKVSKEENEAYFKSRPVGSQVGAWASKQSSVIEEDALASRLKKFRERFGVTEDASEGDVPAPEFWGGWRVIPDEMEFWLGKPSRLHDRIRYVRVDRSASDEEPRWKVDRLSP